jgi:hypothetical protein
LLNRAIGVWFSALVAASCGSSRFAEGGLVGSEVLV